MEQENNTPVTALFQKKSEEQRVSAPVAVFDSGVGGIGVLREIRRIAPCEELLYFGDSANAPYGLRDRNEVRELVLSHAAQLLSRAKALVLGCNTATALAVSELRRRYPDVPIIGMEPALAPALAVREHPRILVLATPITLREGRFAALLKRKAAGAAVVPIAAGELVRLVEGDRVHTPACEAYLAELLTPYLDPVPDALVLGCTHFSFAVGAIRRVIGQEIPIFDGNAGTARQLMRRLQAAGLCNPTPARGAVTLTSSDQKMLPLYARLLFAEE